MHNYSCIFVPATYCCLVFIELVFYDGHKNIIISIVRTIDNRGERSATTMTVEKLSVAMHRAIVSLIEDF